MAYGTTRQHDQAKAAEGALAILAKPIPLYPPSAASARLGEVGRWESEPRSNWCTKANSVPSQVWTAISTLVSGSKKLKETVIDAPAPLNAHKASAVCGIIAVYVIAKIGASLRSSADLDAAAAASCVRACSPRLKLLLSHCERNK